MVINNLLPNILKPHGIEIEKKKDNIPDSRICQESFKRKKKLVEGKNIKLLVRNQICWLPKLIYKMKSNYFTKQALELEVKKSSECV